MDRLRNTERGGKEGGGVVEWGVMTKVGGTRDSARDQR